MRQGKAYVFLHEQPIEDRARPLAILLHGEDSVPAETEEFEPACAAVMAMAERMRTDLHHGLPGRTCRSGSRWFILM